MNNYNEQDLNNLFEKAKTEPVHSSFEETKQQFINSSDAANASDKRWIGKIINLKSIIMITLISAITLTVVFHTDSTVEKKPLQQQKIVMVSEESDSSEILNEPIKVIQDYYKEEIHKSVKAKPFNTDTLVKERIKLAPQSQQKIVEEIEAKTNSVRAIFSDPFRFPKLTDKEIAENHKQKAKMTKHLAKFNEKYYSYIPSSNYKKVSIQGFYIQKTEVSNLEYRTFLFDLIIQNRKEDFLIAQPDQKMWTKEFPSASTEPMELNYFSHPAYDEYPVVAISRAGAELYCKWLTLETIKGFPKKTDKLNDVRIPTNWEWMLAASGSIESNDYPWDGDSTTNEKGCYLANYAPKTGMFSDGGFFPVKVSSYLENAFGLFCMSGNVAEMIYYTSTKKVPGTKGGSWNSSASELKVDGKDLWKGKTAPSVNIGFRPVITYTGNTYFK